MMGSSNVPNQAMKRPWKVLGMLMAFAAIGIFFGLAAVAVDEESRQDSTNGHNGVLIQAVAQWWAGGWRYPVS
eukprot:4293894-Pyramimonas_sp.AAC.1